MSEQPSTRDELIAKAVRALVEKFTTAEGPRNYQWDPEGPDDESNPYYLKRTIDERAEDGAWVAFRDSDGCSASRPATIGEIVEVLSNSGLLADPEQTAELAEWRAQAEQGGQGWPLLRVRQALGTPAGRAVSVHAAEVVAERDQARHDMSTYLQEDGQDWERIRYALGRHPEDDRDGLIDFAKKLADSADEVTAERDALREILGCIWLYVKWRYVTKQLTTEQKNMWADAVDWWSSVLNNSAADPVADRWWNDDESTSPSTSPSTVDSGEVVAKLDPEQTR